METANNELLAPEAGGGFAPFSVVVNCVAAVPDELVVVFGVGLEIVLAVVAEFVAEATWAVCATTVCVVAAEVAEAFTGFKVCTVEPVVVVWELTILEVKSEVEFCPSESFAESSP